MPPLRPTNAEYQQLTDEQLELAAQNKEKIATIVEQIERIMEKPANQYIAIQSRRVFAPWRTTSGKLVGSSATAVYKLPHHEAGVSSQAWLNRDREGRVTLFTNEINLWPEGVQDATTTNAQPRVWIIGGELRFGPGHVAMEQLLPEDKAVFLDDVADTLDRIESANDLSNRTNAAHPVGRTAMLG